MRKVLFGICLFMSVYSVVSAQEEKKEEDVPSSAKEQRRISKLFGRAQYPLIKSHKMTAVLPVNDIDEQPDTAQPYKLLFSWTLGVKDSTKAKKANYALTEIGRILNLHIASGIPRKNIEVVVAVHGISLFSIQDDEAYRKKFHTKNPNKELLKELQDAGVKFIACGQAMAYLDIDKSTLLPGVKTALTAQTMLSSYQLKGFVLFNEDSED